MGLNRFSGTAPINASAAETQPIGAPIVTPDTGNTTSVDFASAVEQRAQEIAERLLQERLQAIRQVPEGELQDEEGLEEHAHPGCPGQNRNHQQHQPLSCEE